MTLIATYDFHYGHKGPMDAQAPLLRRGDSFEPRPTVQASAAEVAEFMIARGSGVTPEAWAKRKPESDRNYDWARAEVARLNARGQS